MNVPRSDGRDIDSRIANLTGEASGQRVEQEEISSEVWEATPGELTYYGRPLLKESVWGIDIPLYYFCGGAAGAALVLAAAIQAAGDRDLRRLSATCHWIGIAGSTAGAALLIHDLGRPERFFYMMRVFRPTSPMNMGVWILSGAAPTALLTGLLINRRGLAGLIGEVAGYLSGIFGAALAGYTGVLVSNSALPLWQDARRWMPPLFTASSMSAAASILEMFSENSRADAITQVFGTAGRVAELCAAQFVERSATIPRVARPLRTGTSGLLWKASAAMTAASLVLSLVPRRSRRVRHLAGVLGATGSLCLRFAVHYATQASARDASASFQHQRAGANR